jgi:hypothetical protein
VNRSVNLEYQSLLRAVEIHDKAINDVLTAELETQNLAVSENAPGLVLGFRGAASESARL